MTDYIPKLATIEQSCEWLRARLGGVWILPRLLECHLKPYFWIDYKPEYQQIFGGKVEGYLTWMIFASDVYRLEVDGTNALVNMFTTHDGTPVKIEPGWIVPLSELRFKREALERVASILEGEVSRQNPASSGTPKSDELPAPAAAALSKDGPRGLTKKEMLANEWPIPSRINLERLLSDVPVWLTPARLNKGAPGKASALWNPAMLALCLAADKAISKTALTRYIANYMPDWADEWESLSDSL